MPGVFINNNGVMSEHSVTNNHVTKDSLTAHDGLLLKQQSYCWLQFTPRANNFTLHHILQLSVLNENDS